MIRLIWCRFRHAVAWFTTINLAKSSLQVMSYKTRWQEKPNLVAQSNPFHCIRQLSTTLFEFASTAESELNHLFVSEASTQLNTCPCLAAIGIFTYFIDWCFTPYMLKHIPSTTQFSEPLLAKL